MASLEKDTVVNVTDDNSHLDDTFVLKNNEFEEEFQTGATVFEVIKETALRIIDAQKGSGKDSTKLITKLESIIGEHICQLRENKCTNICEELQVQFRKRLVKSPIDLEGSRVSFMLEHICHKLYHTYSLKQLSHLKSHFIPDLEEEKS